MKSATSSDQIAVSSNTTTSSAPAKDDDAVKLFVGQIPREMNEEQLRPVFGEYGTIFDLTVIRDKNTGGHRGCAFLTYCTKESAEKAIEGLHNQMKLPNAQNPLQVGQQKKRLGNTGPYFIPHDSYLYPLPSSLCAALFILVKIQRPMVRQRVNTCGFGL